MSPASARVEQGTAQTQDRLQEPRAAAAVIKDDNRAGYRHDVFHPPVSPAANHEGR